MTTPSPRQLFHLLIRKVLPWIFLLAALYQVRLIASTALGKESLFEVWIVWMSQAKVTRMSAIVFGLAGVAYGLAQRALRRAETQRSSARLAELEAQFAARENQ